MAVERVFSFEKDIGRHAFEDVKEQLS